MVTQNQDVFETLSLIDCSKHTEEKQGLTYLSWAWAWGILKTKYPKATYKVREWDNIPYLYDKNLGYLVETSVTIEGETLSMRLPVMDARNRAMKSEPYTIKYTKSEVKVEAATMFDINTAIMRCLVKNLAMFGLGHYIYAGEDLPNEELYITQTLEEKEDELFTRQKDAAVTFLKANEKGRQYYLSEVKKESLDDVTDGEWKKIYIDLIKFKYIKEVA